MAILCVGHWAGSAASVVSKSQSLRFSARSVTGLRVLLSGPAHLPSPSSFLPPPHCFLMTVKTPLPAQTFLPSSTPTPLTAWRTFPPGWSTSHPNCEQGPNQTHDFLLCLPPPPGCVLHENLVEVLFISVHESAEKRGRMLVRRLLRR